MEGDVNTVTPELALVDPELAAAWRERLPDPVSLKPAPLASGAQFAGDRAEQAPPHTPAAARRRTRRVWVMTGALGVAAAALALVLWRDGGRGDGVRAQPSRTTTTTGSAHESQPQTFVWAAASGSVGYEFQLFRGTTLVYRARARTPRFELPRSWQRGGRSYSLEPGGYRWYVWSISASTGRPDPVAIVQAQLIVE